MMFAKAFKISMGITLITLAVVLSLCLNVVYQTSPHMYSHSWDAMSMMIGPFTLFVCGIALLNKD